jgi:transposase
MDEATLESWGASLREAIRRLSRIVALYLSASGMKPPVVEAAIAREMAAFLWAIGGEVAPS